MIPVLLVDDQRRYAARVQQRLDMMGFKVWWVRNAQDCFETASVRRPHVIIVAAELEPISGLSICNGLKRDPMLKRIPLIIVTNKALKELADHRRRSTRADAYLRRADDLDDLFDHVRELAARHKKAQKAVRRPRVASPAAAGRRQRGSERPERERRTGPGEPSSAPPGAEAAPAPSPGGPRNKDLEQLLTMPSNKVVTDKPPAEPQEAAVTTSDSEPAAPAPAPTPAAAPAPAGLDLDLDMASPAQDVAPPADDATVPAEATDALTAAIEDQAEIIRLERVVAAQAKELASERAAFEEQHAKLLEEQTSLEARLAAERTAFEQQLEKQLEEQQALDAQLAEAHQRITAIATTANEQATRINQLQEDKAAEVVGLQVALDTAEQQLETLARDRAKLAELESERPTDPGANHYIAQLEKVHAGELEKCEHAHAAQIRLIEEQLDEARSEADAARGKQQDAAEQLEDERAERLDATERVEALEEERSQLLGKVADLQARLKDGKQQAAVPDDLAALDKRVAELREQTGKLEKDLEAMEQARRDERQAHERELAELDEAHARELVELDEAHAVQVAELDKA